MNKCTWEKLNKASGRKRHTIFKAGCTGEKVKIQSTVILGIEVQYDKPFSYCPYCGKPVQYD